MSLLTLSPSSRPLPLSLPYLWISLEKPPWMLLLPSPFNLLEFLDFQFRSLISGEFYVGRVSFTLTLTLLSPEGCNLTTPQPFPMNDKYTSSPSTSTPEKYHFVDSITISDSLAFETIVPETEMGFPFVDSEPISEFASQKRRLREVTDAPPFLSRSKMFGGDRFPQDILNICVPNIPWERIPPSFIEHMDRQPKGFATLRVAGRGKWRVKLSEEEDGVVFGDGWETFYRENSLKVTDLLVFVYRANLKFNVNIYDNGGTQIM